MQLLCGIVAGGVAGTLITPLEIIKTRVMGGQGGRTVGQVVNKVTQVEGVQSVMQGSFSISIIKTALEKGIQVWVLCELEIPSNVYCMSFLYVNLVNFKRDVRSSR